MSLLRRPERPYYPLSLQQRNIWYQIQLHSDLLVYRTGVELTLTGPLDLEALRQALRDVVQKQDALRAIFSWIGGEAVQRILPCMEADCPVEDFSALPAEHRHERLRARIDELVSVPYDLVLGPLFRFRLLREEEEIHHLLLGVHHLVADGVTLNLFARQVLGFYQAGPLGEEAPSTPAIRYQDYAVWQIEALESGALAKHEAWWLERFRVPPRPLELPADRPRPPVQSFQGDWVFRWLPASALSALRAFAAPRRLSLFRIALAGFEALLHRLTGEIDLVVNVPATNRPPEILDVIGCFVITLAVRSDLAGDPSFAELALRVSGDLREALRHREYPFNEALRHLQSGHDPSHGSIPTVGVTQRLYAAEQQAREIRLRDVRQCDLDWALLDLNLGVEETPEDLKLSLNYSTDIFEEATVFRLANALEALLVSAAANPDARVSELEILTEAEREQLRLRPFPAQPFHPLTFNQWDIWLQCRLHSGRPYYNCFFAVTLSGPLQPEALRRSLQATIDRHDALRAVFPMVGEEPVMRILPRLEVDCPLEDLSRLEEEEVREKLRRREEEMAEEPFDLATGPLVRARIIRLDEDRHRLILVLHHLINDQLNQAPLVREVVERCEAWQRGEIFAPPHLAVQFQDFATWQHARWKAGLLALHRGYWLRRLRNLPPTLELPVDYPRPPVQTFAAATVRRRLPDALVRGLEGLRRDLGTSFFRLVLTALEAFLGRASGETDLVVITPVSTRPPGLEDLTGYFSLGLPLRVDLSGDPPFRELAVRVDEVVRQAMEHRDVPMGEVLRELRLERDPSRPLFSVCISQARPLDEAGRDLRLGEGDFSMPGVVFDLWVLVLRSANGVEVSFKHNIDLFEPPTIARWMACFERLLESVVADPEARISELEVLPEEQWRQVVVLGGGAAAPRLERTVGEVFAAWAAAQPEAVAVVSERRRETYSELCRRAGRLASWLSARGIGWEDPVGVLGERGAEWVAALLAVQEVGGVYLPLEPGHPDARLVELLRDSGARWLLCSEKLVERARLLAGSSGPAEVLVWNAALAGGEEPWRPARPGGVGGLASLFYTSGSTGSPKGALVEYRGMLAHLWAKVELLGLEASSAVAQNASQGFDISIWQMLAPLLAGGRVVVYGEAEASDVAGLLGRVERDGVTVLETVPSLLEAMLGELPESGGPRLGCLEYLISNAETLPVPLARRWLERFPHVALVNTYGATECSDDVTHQVFRTASEVGGARVGVGRPIAGMRVWVLDEGLRPVPSGWPGQVAFAGVGVGRGYLGDTGKTARTFMPDPWAEEPGGRLYLTGDQGRWGSEGNLEFLGRLDRQVKVRGHRIEPGEVEAALVRLEGVRQAVVEARPDPQGRLRLLAWVTADRPLAGDALRERLRERLPAAALPEQIVLLAALPLTRNGKIDRRALPEPERMERPGWVAPRDELEERIAGVWREVLHLDRIGVHDNFFALGGDSIQSIRVAIRLRRAGFELAAHELFEHQTVAELARILAPRRATASPELQPAGAVGTPLLVDLEEGELDEFFLDMSETGAP
jgi:amino acid adenylation domain-containing protein